MPPVSTIPSLIGSKGATLKEIRDKTGVKIDIPRKESLQANGQANGASHSPSRNATPLPGDNPEDEEPTIPVTITGPQPLVLEAQAMLEEIVASRTSHSTQRAKDIPPHAPFSTALSRLPPASVLCPGGKERPRERRGRIQVKPMIAQPPQEGSRPTHSGCRGRP